VVFSGEDQRRSEAEAGAAAFLAGAGSTQVSVLRFRDGFFPEQWGRIKEAVEELKAQEPPDVILTHHRHDRHQDHRILAELTWNTWRNQLILEYEVPKYEGDLGHPNLYVPVDREVADLKVEHLMRLFETQRSRSWFDRATFLGLLRLRGVECASPSGYAEAFHAAKLTLT
jgi:LmbE family N-acetylglucosaminyl deacetylase